APAGRRRDAPRAAGRTRRRIGQCASPGRGEGARCAALPLKPFPLAWMLVGSLPRLTRQRFLFVKACLRRKMDPLLVSAATRVHSPSKTGVNAIRDAPLPAG